MDSPTYSYPWYTRFKTSILSDGIRYLTNEVGYNAIVRNSGGLGVVLDQGVLNISLIFKGQTETTIDEAFTVMYLLICKMFEDEDVDIHT